MKQWNRASYTVEAALLMGVLIPLLVGIIYFSCSLHNQTYLQNAAYETAAVVCMYQGEKEVLTLSEAIKNLRMNGLIPGDKNATGKVKISKGEVQIIMRGEVHIPTLIPGMFPKDMGSTKVHIRTNIERPSMAILKIHKIKKWAKEGETE